MGKVTRNSSGKAAMLKAIDECSKYVAKVGFFPSAKYPDGTPIAYVAAIQENGFPSRSLPARPFFRPTADAKKSTWKDQIGRGMATVMKGKRTVRDVLEIVSAGASGDIRATIAAIDGPALSPITLMARKYRQAGGKVTGKTIGEFAKQLKGNPNIDLSGVSTKPLNDTGALLAHLTNVVESK
jgi:hypothetical protein